MYNKLKFQHLAPLSNISKENSNVFEESMDFALGDENIHNIAVTGPYGSGKSSLIKSYEKHHNYDFLNISLATFEIKKSLDNQKQQHPFDSKDNEQEDSFIPFSMLQRIEKSILQQMFYKEPLWKLPFSRFRRIRNINWFQTVLLLIVVWGIILFPSAIIDPKGWSYIEEIAFLKNSKVLFVFLWLFFISASLGISICIRFCNKITISKIGLKNIDIDLDIKDKNSLLNKYLDEVLYFFEVTNYKVVVFEDLDRFENAEIFIKLRELNTLLNSSKKIIKGKRKKVTFIYALKDEVFTDSKRTKFFDFIIPIIPIINNQNSCDILLNIKKDNPDTALTDIDNHFLMDIGLYVSDMRLLKNCINEFQIYEQIVNKDIYLEKITTDKTKLANIRTKIFALVLYKNLYPEDFALLQENKGYLYNIFQLKEEAVKILKEKLLNEIKEKEEEIEYIKRLTFNSIEELRKTYILKILELSTSFIQLNSIDYLSDAVFEKLQSDNKITVNYAVARSTGYGNPPIIEGRKNDISIDFNTIQNSIDSKQTYKEKEEIIFQKQNGREKEIRSEIQECETEIKVLSSSPLALIINKYNDTSFIQNDDNINKELVIYLLRNSYVDEHYFDYISYFYPGALSSTDKEFLLLLRNYGEPDFTKQLNNIGTVVERIHPSEWNNPAILNNSLLTYLLKHNTGYLTNFIQTMFEYDSKNTYAFFKQYNNDNYTALKIFYSKIYGFVKNKTNWENILFEAKEDKHLFDFFMLVDLEEDDHIKQLITENLPIFYRPLTSEQKDTITKKFKILNIQFNLDKEYFKNEISDIVIKNHLYELTKENLNEILNWYNKKQKESYTNYLTEISKLKEESIKQYVKNNLDYVLENVILVQGTVNETEDVVLGIIQNEDVSIENKQILIEKNDNKISSISKVDHFLNYSENEEEQKLDVWSLLFENNKIIRNWENVITYFKSDSENKKQIVTNYLNLFGNDPFIFMEEPLTKEERGNKENEKYKVVKEFYSDIVLDNENLSKNSFALLMEQCPWSWKEIPNYSISAEKLRTLIEKKEITLTEENYIGIKNNHIDLLPLYISTFINTPKLYELLTVEDIIAFIKNTDVKTAQKFELLSSDCPILRTIKDSQIFLLIANLVVLNNYGKSINVSESALMEAISQDWDIENILKFIVLQIDFWDKKEIENAFSYLPKPYNELVQKSRKIKRIYVSESNRIILDKLKLYGFVTSYSSNEKQFVVHRKQK